jgi:hypothetical protein
MDLEFAHCRMYIIRVRSRHCPGILLPTLAALLYVVTRTLNQCFPNFLFSGPVLDLENNRLSPRPRSRIYSRRMTGIRN